MTRVKFTRDGSRIETVSTDGTRRSWDPEPEPWMHIVPKPAACTGPSRVAETHGLRAEIDRNKVVVTNLVTGQVTPLFGQFGDIHDVSFSPDGRWVVTAGPIAGGLCARIRARSTRISATPTDHWPLIPERHPDRHACTGREVPRMDLRLLRHPRRVDPHRQDTACADRADIHCGRAPQLLESLTRR